MARPTKPGYYWYLAEGALVPEVVRVVNENTIYTHGKDKLVVLMFCANDFVDLSTMPGHFAGPLKHPFHLEGVL